MNPGIVVLIIVLVVAVIILAKSVTIIHQAEKGIVERLGKYKETLDPGLKFLVPFLDVLISRIDMRETVLDIPPPAGHHQGQCHRNHRCRCLLLCHRRQGSQIRGSQLLQCCQQAGTDKHQKCGW
ncbi:SPFH domain-containing protein [Chloroflexota bacterium]